MRAVILILILAVVAAIVAIASGFLSIDQVRPAKAPEISTTGSGISARGGQAPAFDVETGRVTVGADQRNVTVAVPRVEVRGPDSADSATTDGNEAAPAR